jgi:hypothetical protein
MLTEKKIDKKSYTKYIHFESFKALDPCNYTYVFGIPRIQTHIQMNVSSSDGGTTLK